MKNTNAFFIKISGLFLTIMILSSQSFAILPGKKINPARNGKPVKILASQSKDLAAATTMESARLWGERMDNQMPQLEALANMGRLQRWWRGQDVEALRLEYTKDTISHLKAMAQVFKAHRLSRGFKKMREFEFEIMIRKSDYLMSLHLTKENLLLAEQYFLKEELKQAVASYNFERKFYDQKVIQIAGT